MTRPVSEILAGAQARVRSAPGDPDARFALFRAYVLAGLWDRARTHLEVATTMNGSALATRVFYATAIAAEAVRAEVFEGARVPLVMGEPSEWVALQVQALQPAADRAALRERAVAEFPDTPARESGRDLEVVSDADPRLGPVFELFIDGRYYWVPFDRVARIDWESPADPLDLVWLPCSVVLRDGGATLSCLMPLRYPGTLQSGDDELVLGHATDWHDVEGESHGLGQRMFWSNLGCFQVAASRGLEFLGVD